MLSAFMLATALPLSASLAEGAPLKAPRPAQAPFLEVWHGETQRVGHLGTARIRLAPRWNGPLGAPR
jgi:hypothetical protein